MSTGLRQDTGGPHRPATLRISFAVHSFVTALLFASSFSSSLLFGQATSGDLVGTVTDPSGSAVPGASVEAKNVATGVATSTKAGSNGAYRLSNLLVGRYDLAATAPGFTVSTVRGVDVQLNRVATANFTVQLGQVTTTVDVRESAAVIDTTTSQLQSTFEGRDARELPQASTGYGVLNLSLLGAGVASTGGLGYGDGPSVGGQRPTNNNFNIEGIDNNDKGITGPIVFVPNDAVGQFSLLQNQFSPEFGFSSGGIFNTNIRTGTNTLHGTIYEYLQNRNLNAIDASDARQGFRENPRLDNNRLGANIGGAVIKNKLFYFADFEYNPIGKNSPPAGQILAPTAAGYSVLGGLAGVSKTNLGILQQYAGAAPAAAASPVMIGGVSVPVGPISIASPDFSNQYNLVVAGDWNIRDADQLRIRYIYNKFSGIDTMASLPFFFSPYPNNVHLASVSEFHNFSPTLTNELRLAYSRRFNDYPIGNATFPGLDAFPNLTIDELNLQIGPDPNSPQGYIQNTFQATENATKIWSKHTLKFGYDFHDTIASNTFVQRARGDYEYSNLSQYLLDLSPDVLAERSVGSSGGIPVGFLQHALFLNDDFRLRPNLTINLGLRYEYITVPIVSRAQKLNSLADVPGLITFREPKPTKNDWAPRIGIAYSPGTSGKSSIRAGFGLSYDQFYNNLSVTAEPPLYQQTVDLNLNASTPDFLKSGAIGQTLPPPPASPAEARAQTSAYTFNQVRPYSINWTLGVQHVFASDYTAEVRYVGTRGVHLQVQERLNIASPVTASQSIPTFFSTPGPAQLSSLTTTLGGLKAIPSNLWASYGFTQPVTAYPPWGNSSYHGLALQLTRRFTRNLSFMGAYTWSHNIDDSTATLFSTFLTPRRAQDFQNLRADRSSSALDRRHRFTFTTNYDVPAFRASSPLLKNGLGNWNFVGTYTYESPEYATVQSNIDSNLNGDSAGDRAVINPAGRGNSSTDVIALNSAGQTVAPGSDAIVAYVANDSSARYVRAGQGAYPNGGRNTLALNPINNFDASVVKRFSFHERLRFEIGGQFFNVLNHPQFIPGYLSDVQHRAFTSSRNFLIPGNAGFGQFDQYFPSNSRTAQIVAKFSF